MYKTRSGLIRLIAFSAVLIFTATGCMGGKIIRVSDQKELEMPELVAEARRVEVVFVGELHNRKAHHEAQLKLIKALHEIGVPVSIGVEMFKAESQEALDKWVSGELGVEEFKEAYRRNWGMPWYQYRDIFLYARKNGLPLVGLNVSRKIIHQVFKGGFDSLTAEQMKELPPGVECRVDKKYEEFIREAMGEHEMDDATFRSFCEAQMVWDNAMAYNTIEYLKVNPGRKMVVLAGNGHSWKRGIPQQLDRLSELTYLVILPESGGLDREDIGLDDADYVITDGLF